MISTNSRSWIPFVFLLVLVGFVIVYVFFGNLLFTSTRQPVQPSPGCIAIQDNSDSDNSVDVVFLPDNFQDVEKFREKTNKMIQSFENTKPYSTYKDRFNFFRIEQFGLDLKCNYKYGGDAIVCDPTAVKNAATLCPHDYVIVAVDTDGIQKLFDLLRSSSWMGIASVNSADDPLVFSHEFSHLFASFADEYEYGGTINWDAPNCDSNFETCPKFKAVNNSECIKGCVNSENSRSINVGIMRDYWKSKVFGSYDEYSITSFILKSTKASSSNQVTKSMPIDLVELSYVNNQWKIQDVKQSNGYPDGKNTGVDSNSKLIIQDKDYKNVYELNLNVPIMYFDGHDNESNPSYNTTIMEGTTYVVAVPKLDNSNRITVQENNVVLSAYNLQKDVLGSMSFNTISVGVPQTFSSS